MRMKKHPRKKNPKVYKKFFDDIEEDISTSKTLIEEAVPNNLKNQLSSVCGPNKATSVNDQLLWKHYRL